MNELTDYYERTYEKYSVYVCMKLIVPVITYNARLKISAGHWTFVRQIWGFDKETVQSDRTPWRASPVNLRW